MSNQNINLNENTLEKYFYMDEDVLRYENLLLEKMKNFAKKKRRSLEKKRNELIKEKQSKKTSMKSGIYNVDNLLYHENNFLLNSVESRIYRSGFGGLTRVEKEKFNLIKWIKKMNNYLEDLYEHKNRTENNRKRLLKSRTAAISQLRYLNKDIDPENYNLSTQRLLFSKPIQEENHNLFMMLKRKHIKTNNPQYSINFSRPIINQNNLLRSINPFYNGNFNESFERLGIQNLGFSIQNLQKIKIYLNNILLPLNEKITNMTYVFLDKMYLLVSYLLVDLNISIDNNLNEYIYIGKGRWGITYCKNDKLMKFEHLRHSEKKPFVSRFYYSQQNYSSFMYFISFINQHFLSTFHFIDIEEENKIKYYIPNVYDVKFNYNENITKTTMNFANLNKRCNKNRIEGSTFKTKNLDSFLIDDENYKKPTFFLNFFKILKELCKCLVFYQDICSFVHNDLHGGNIVINYKYDENDIIIFELKLIDFLISSIIVKNSENKLSILKFTNMKPYRNPNIVNPLKTTYWNKIDLTYFIILLFYQTFNLERDSIDYFDINKQNNEIFNRKEKELRIMIKKIFKILGIIYNFDENYNIKYKELSQLNRKHGKYYMLLVHSQSERQKVLGDNVRYELFDPRNLLLLLNERIIPFFERNNIENFNSCVSRFRLLF